MREHPVSSHQNKMPALRRDGGGSGSVGTKRNRWPRTLPKSFRLLFFRVASSASDEFAPVYDIVFVDAIRNMRM